MGARSAGWGVLTLAFGSGAAGGTGNTAGTGSAAGTGAGATATSGALTGCAADAGLDPKSRGGVSSGVSATFLAAGFFAGFFAATLAIIKDLSNQLESNYLPDVNSRHALDGVRPD